jgi:two-component system sensor histidine kinase PilS (NtrC family)
MPQAIHYRTPDESHEHLKLLMFSRVVFTSLLLGSTIIVQLSQASSLLAVSMLVLYGLIAGIFILSCIYAYFLKRILDLQRFAQIQVAVDTVIVTLILFVTGGFSSIFAFLYLVVIIYSSIMLPRRQVIWIAALCGLQYSLVVALEHFQVLEPFGFEGAVTAAAFPWLQVLYRILMTTLACFAVAVLSGVLAEQALQTRGELRALEAHVKRVEKLASMGEMAAGMAHEIKNPLASLAGSIQMLQEDLPHNPQHEKLIQIINREASRLGALIQNFLTFARPPAGNRKAVSLSNAAKEIVALFEKDPAHKGQVDIRLELQDNLWIEIDPVHLHQVIWNLLLNGAEAIDGEGVVSVSLFSGKNRQVVLQVQDDGGGMEPDLVQSIFTPFFTTKPKGTGLGLSMVHSILESYNSRVDVHSQVGSGTIFTIYFDRAVPPKKNRRE